MIILFGILSNTFLYYWLKRRREAKYANQYRDVEQTKNLVYIDRQAMKEMQLSMEDLMEMAEQPEKYALSNHLKRLI